MCRVGCLVQRQHALDLFPRPGCRGVCSIFVHIDGVSQSVTKQSTSRELRVKYFRFNFLTL